MKTTELKGRTMNDKERIAALEDALGEMLAQFWGNAAYDDDDKAVLDYANSVFKGANHAND